MKRLPRDVRNNIRFLITEVGSQVSNLRDCFRSASLADAHAIVDRSGYAYNLVLRIHEDCNRHKADSRRASRRVPALNAIESIATELERISELCRNCVRQMEKLEKPRWRDAPEYRAMLKLVSGTIGKIEDALRSNDTKLAMKIGMTKPGLDRKYKRLMKRSMSGLRKRRHTEDLVTGLFIAHGIDQMGDALLHISEAIISANLGQPMNISSYHSLRESIARLETTEDTDQLVVEPLARTRSGSGISGIGRPKSRAGEFVAVFKDGKKRKLRDERRGLENWQQKFPGLAPRILSYRARGQSASLLIEHLAGLTFEQVLLHESSRMLDQSLVQLRKTMQRVWRKSRSTKPVAAGFMRQLSRRLEDVYSIHPEFRQRDGNICGRAIVSYGNLLKAAHAREAGIAPPFSVYIHGDFNVDNIIYDPAGNKISFIDLHRSRYTDYVQDISVFMVSNYRLQVLDTSLRRRIMGVTREFYRFASAYAGRSGDGTFELRLALGLARSFATSTRFILDKSLANAMFLRSRYLIEQVLACKPGDERTFRVPVKEIFVG